MAQTLIVFLHGWGSSGIDFKSLQEEWRLHLPETAFAAPDAPIPFDHEGPGRQWFSLLGITDAERPKRVVGAREGFDETIASVVRDNDFVDRLDQVAFVGFSQGSVMALDAIVSGRWPVGAVVSFAGRLATPEPFSPAALTRICLIHGTADLIVPPMESRSAQARLAQLGFESSLTMLKKPDTQSLRKAAASPANS